MITRLTNWFNDELKWFPSLVSNKIVQAFHQIDKPIKNKIVENKKENIDTQIFSKSGNSNYN